MNYPLWDVPSGGLLIAVIAVIHVFISHFAVGGGLFLVVSEMRARRHGDIAFLEYLKRHSRFFILLTLVLGAMTGVGIWFTIALVHPAATSSLINTYVWGWAVEWTFFFAEIAAAMVYYYGWNRLGRDAHVAVGWIYFLAAWASLAVINGILSYMMTPGRWVADRQFWSGFFNPTYLPSLVMRTFVCIGLAGLYALLTVAWNRDRGLRRRIGRYAALYWVLPMGVAVPLSLVWYLRAAMAAGVPAAAILGAEGEEVTAVVRAIFSASGDTGHPVAQTAAFTAILASLGVLLLTAVLLTVRRRTFGKPLVLVMLLLGLLAMGGGEWLREDLRKPYVIGGYMFVNGVRLPAPDSVPRPPAEAAWQAEDAFSVEALNRTGVLAASPWVRLPEAVLSTETPATPEERAAREAAVGGEVFRLSCSPCHSLDGYLGVAPLVRGQSPVAIERVLTELARPVDAVGKPTSWADPQLRLATWRERRMPPFVGTERERRALAIYLARLGGPPDAGVDLPGRVDRGEQVFEDNCAICHEPGGDWPMRELVRGRDAAALYETIGRLSEVNEMMPDFEGTDEERRALAEYLAGLEASPEGGEALP